MNNKFNKILSNSILIKFIHWSKLIGITGITQIIVQSVGFVCGFLIIRALSVQEYALYTVANTMLGTMIVLTDAGVSSGVLAEGANVWNDKKKLGEVIVTGLHLRKKIALVSLTILIPILFYLLYNNGASIWMSILIVIVLIPGLIASLSGSLLTVPTSLTQDIVPVQKNLLLINISRLILVAPLVLVFPWAFIAIIPSGLTQIYGNFRLRKIIEQYTDLKQNVNNEIKNKLIKFVKRTLPEAIYYCISGQITIWILATFGGTDSVASVGALGRIAVILSFITVMFSTLIQPRFARLETNFKLIFNRFLSIHLLLLFTLSFIVLIVKVFAAEILWILGPNYYNLQEEIVLVMVGSCIGLFSGVTYATCLSKNWIINPLIFIPISVISIIIGVFIFDVKTLSGVLVFNIFVALIQAIMNSMYAYYKIFKMKRI